MNPAAPELLLFHDQSVDETIRLARAGVDGVIVDWETYGKHARQAGWDTKISDADRNALSLLQSTCAVPLLCRVDNHLGVLEADVEAAIAGGATEILLPMVRTPTEVEVFLGRVKGRCRVGILVETQAAVDCVSELARFPLHRIYIGLNDLAIDRHETRSIFLPFLDGTVDRIREQVSLPLGIAGLTHPGVGHPIPARLLLREMARLGCDFTFLRRTFHRDVKVYPPATLVAAIRAEWQVALARDAEEIDADRRALHAAVRGTFS